MRLITVLCIAVLAVAGASSAVPLAVGAAAPDADSWGVVFADSVCATGTGYIRFMGGGGGIPAVDFAAEIEAVVYLYAVSAADVVTKAWGPFYVLDWSGPRSLVPPGEKIDLIQYTTTGDLVVTPRGW